MDDASDSSSSVDVDVRRRLDQERKQFAERLRQSHRLETVGRLASGVAHSFNNALTVICGHCSLVLKRLPASDPNRDDVERILAVADSATQITHQLLEFTHRQPVPPTILDLNVVIRASTNLARPLIGERIEMRTDLSPQILSIRFQQAQLEHVLLNLILNARDAMPSGGTLEIRTSLVQLDGGTRPRGRLPAGRYVEMTVSDSGLGIAPDVVSRIFDPFFTTKGMGRGVGLGLAMVDASVSQHGGLVSVESRAGRGTTFTVLLPVVSETPDVADGSE